MSATINMTFNTDGGVKEVVNFDFLISEMTDLGGGVFEKVINLADPLFYFVPRFMLVKGSGFDTNNKTSLQAKVGNNMVQINSGLASLTSFTRVSRPISDQFNEDISSNNLILRFSATTPPSTARLTGFVEIVKFSV